MEEQNYQVTTKINCDNIAHDIRHAKPNIILMDLWIPEMGGEHTICLIELDEAILHIPVILFSANASIEEIALRSGATAFLRKPFEITGLLDVIENNISKVEMA